MGHVGLRTWLRSPSHQLQVCELCEVHVPKGYIYFAMAFSVMVEVLNLRVRTRRAPPIRLHRRYAGTMEKNRERQIVRVKTCSAFASVRNSGFHEGLRAACYVFTASAAIHSHRSRHFNWYGVSGAYVSPASGGMPGHRSDAVGQAAEGPRFTLLLSRT